MDISKLPILDVVKSSLENIHLTAMNVSEKANRSKAVPLAYKQSFKEISTLCASALNHIHTLERDLEKIDFHDTVPYHLQG